MAPALSLVVSTIGRPALLTRLVRSLCVEAASASFELIVVDQSDSLSAHDVVRDNAVGYPWSVHTSARGVSLGRNLGLARASSPLVAFPDDDCWFPGTTLAKAIYLLEADTQLSGLTAMLRDGEGHPTMLRWAPSGRLVTRNNYYRTSIGPTVFTRTSQALQVGGFDEQVGPGAGTPFGSCEDADLLLRLVEHGPVAYHPELWVHHDEIQATLEASLCDKMYGYGRGQAWFWRRHDYPWWHMAHFLGRKMAKIALYSAGGRVADVATDRAFLRGAFGGLAQGRDVR